MIRLPIRSVAILAFAIALRAAPAQQPRTVAPCGQNEVLIALRAANTSSSDATIMRSSTTLPCDVILLTGSAPNAGTIQTAGIQVRLLADPVVGQSAPGGSVFHVRTRPQAAGARPIPLVYRRIAQDLPTIPEENIRGLGTVRAVRLVLPGTVKRSP